MYQIKSDTKTVIYEADGVYSFEDDTAVWFTLSAQPSGSQQLVYTLNSDTTRHSFDAPKANETIDSTGKLYYSLVFRDVLTAPGTVNVFLYTPSSGGGSSSSSPSPSTSTNTNSTTETSTRADGSALETKVDTTSTTTTNRDGSVTEAQSTTVTTTSTAEDGSTTETVTGNTKDVTTNTVTNRDGSVTDTEAVKATDSVTVTSTDADGNATTTATVTDTQSNTETTTVKNADGTSTASTETKETVTATETVTAADGSKSTTKTETVTETNLVLTTATDGTVSGTGTSTSTTVVTDDSGAVLSTTKVESEIAVSTSTEGDLVTETKATTTVTDAEGNETTQITTTTKAETEDGTTGTIVADENGTPIAAEASLSSTSIEKAQESGEPIRTPLLLEPAKSSSNFVPVQVDVPAGLLDRNGDNHVSVPEMPRMEIAVTGKGPGIVAMYHSADGHYTPVKECYEGSVIVPIAGNCQIVIMDNNKVFDDVTKNAWYEDAVTFVTAREIYNGYGNGNFGPDDSMTRAMAAQVLYNFDREAVGGDGSLFTDVDTADWFCSAIGWAYENGVANGYGDSYGALDQVTRQDLVTILYNYAKLIGYDVSADASVSAFSDAGDVSGYALEAMQWAIGAGLIKGVTDQTLSPKSSTTRAQVAAIMMRFISNVK